MNTRNTYKVLALAVLTVHAVILSVLPSPVASSDLLLDAAAGVACAACFYRSRLCLGAARWKWRLVACGLLIWFAGQALVTYDEGLLRLEQAATAINADFYFFLFGIPLLLTISSANERKLMRSFLWIDGLQAALAIYLVHLQIFPGVSGSPEQDAISSLRMTYAYNAENFVLAIACGLRLIARPQGEEKHLYRSLLVFLGVYTIAAAVLNHLSSVEHLPTGTYFDLFWDLPFLLFAFLVGRSPRAEEPETRRDQTWAGLLMTNVSPLFFSLALLVMGVYVARTRFALGVAAIVFALISYGLRSSLLHAQAMRTEQKLLESEAALLEANLRLEQLSFLDSLTGIPNRRRFEEVLRAEWTRAKRAGVPLCLLVIDIDDFKLLNDRYGHLYGDACLIETARALESCLRRSGDLVARYAGDEFVALLPGAEYHQALTVAEKMTLSVDRLRIANEDALTKRMTISIGVASSNHARAVASEDLFALADQALYSAKVGVH